MLSASVCRQSLSLLIVCAIAIPIAAEQQPEQQKAAAPAAEQSAKRQAELEAKLSKTLSGATLEGSYTIAGSGVEEPSKLNREKYTLGEVKKVTGDVWQFPTRIQYGGNDLTLPIPLPIRWAGDTPIVVVDEVMLPGFGTVSARVLFFDGHYAGYWKHGEHSGNLFGEIHPAGEKTSPLESAKANATPSSGNPPTDKKP
jgi:hypothetical protein